MAQAAVCLIEDAGMYRPGKFLSTCLVLSTTLFLIFTAGCAGVSKQLEPHPMQPQAPNLSPPLFALREMDMHLHAGLERTAPLDQWIDAAVADGRKVVIALDHRELYDMSAGEYEAWLAENKFPKWYPVGAAGKQALMDDLALLRKRKDVTVFRGWEIWEGELDEGLDPDAMRLAEVIGWHISSNGDPPPSGEMLLKRVRQILQVQEEFPVPMIVFHPFTAGISRVQKDARKAGKDPASLTAEDYRFFGPGEQDELALLLRGKPVYIEISQGQARCMENPAMRAALIADIKPLAAAGVQFTVSTDAHGFESLRHRFEPEVYCAPIGVTPQNTNGVVRELLARRAAADRANRQASPRR